MNHSIKPGKPWQKDYVMTKVRYEWLKRLIASNYDKNYKASIFEKMKLIAP